jgi:hypothetical protein
MGDPTTMLLSNEIAVVASDLKAEAAHLARLMPEIIEDDGFWRSRFTPVDTSSRSANRCVTSPRARRSGRWRWGSLRAGNPR